MGVCYELSFKSLLGRASLQSLLREGGEQVRGWMDFALKSARLDCGFFRFER